MKASRMVLFRIAGIAIICALLFVSLALNRTPALPVSVYEYPSDMLNEERVELFADGTFRYYYFSDEGGRRPMASGPFSETPEFLTLKATNSDRRHPPMQHTTWRKTVMLGHKVLILPEAYKALQRGRAPYKTCILWPEHAITKRGGMRQTPLALRELEKNENGK